MTACPPARWPVLAAAILLVVPLGACKRDAASSDAAASQVLPGSVSDAMLPVDRLTSQPPLDPRADRSVGGGEAKGSASEAAGADEAAKPAPVAEGAGAAD
jgi:hypothetical protein